MNLDLEHKLAQHIRREIVRASSDFQLIEAHDKILVCVSGGKDSSILLVLLNEIKKRAGFPFQLEAAILDQKQPGFQIDEFKRFVDSVGVPFHIIEKDTYSIVTEKIKTGTYCSLCSRLRRAILYDFAHARGFNKMALGHHRDDLIETTLLNLFYSGNLASMPPRLVSDDQRNIVIRPLAYVPEKQLIELSQTWNFPIIPCNLCGSQEGMKRKRMKSLISQLELEIPNLGSTFMTALCNVKLSQLPQLKNQSLMSEATVSSSKPLAEGTLAPAAGFDLSIEPN